MTDATGPSRVLVLLGALVLTGSAAGMLLPGTAPAASAAPITSPVSCSSVVISDLITGSSSNLLPGSSTTTTVTLTNATGVPVQVLLTATTTDDPAGLGTVSTWTATGTTTGTPGATITPASAALTGAGTQQFATLPPGAAVHTTITTGVNPSAGNTYQGAHATYTITATTTQVP